MNRDERERGLWVGIGGGTTRHYLRPDGTTRCGLIVDGNTSLATGRRLPGKPCHKCEEAHRRASLLKEESLRRARSQPLHRPVDRR
jgi:hypothetical protein